MSFTIIVLYNPINRLNKNIATGCSWKIVCNWAYDYPKSKCIIYFRSTEISRFFELMVTLFNVVMYNIASTKNNLLPLLRIYICLMLSWWPTDIARNVSFAIIVEFIYCWIIQVVKFDFLYHLENAPNVAPIKSIGIVHAYCILWPHWLISYPNCYISSIVIYIFEVAWLPFMTNACIILQCLYCQ